jgi:hypothetical protein
VTIDRVRLTLALVLFAVLLAVVTVRGRDPNLVGAIVAGLGLSLRMWATGCLDKNRTLATAGPYRWTRNPLYVGTLIVAVGAVVMVEWWPLLLGVAALVVVYHVRVLSEEPPLAERFGEAYRQYCARTPRWLSVWPRRSAQPAAEPSSQFSWSRAFRSREARNIVVFFIFIVLVDICGDVLHTWLVQHRPLSEGLSALGDWARLLRRGHF